MFRFAALRFFGGEESTPRLAGIYGSAVIGGGGLYLNVLSPNVSVHILERVASNQMAVQSVEI